MDGTLKENRVCWCLLILVLVGIEATGIYFLKTALTDPQTKEISNLQYALRRWNESYESFEGMQVELVNSSLSQNRTQTWGTAIKDFPVYPVYFYSGYVSISLATNNFELKFAEVGLEYNLTTSITLAITDRNLETVNNTIKNVVVYSRKKSYSNFKVCNNENMGFWDSQSKTCYHDFQTKRFCFVVDRNYSVIEWYLSGCDDSSYYEQDMVRWKKADVVRNVSLEVFTEVRSEDDPFVYASYNGMSEFSYSASEYKIIGISLVSVSTGLMVFTGFMICCSRRKRKYLMMHDLNKA